MFIDKLSKFGEKDGDIDEIDGEVVPAYKGVNAPKNTTAEYFDEVAEIHKPSSGSDVYDGEVPAEFMPEGSIEHLVWRADELAKDAARKIVEERLELDRKSRERDLETVRNHQDGQLEVEPRREDGLSPRWVDLGGGIGSMPQQDSSQDPTTPPANSGRKRPTKYVQNARKHEKRARKDRRGK